MTTKNYKTLRDLLAEFFGTGCVVIDCGSGSAGARWLPEEDLADKLDTPMHVCRADDHADFDGSGTIRTLGRIVKEVTGQTVSGTVYASDWIVTGQGDNPLRYRLIF